MAIYVAPFSTRAYKVYMYKMWVANFGGHMLVSVKQMLTSAIIPVGVRCSGQVLPS